MPTLTLEGFNLANAERRLCVEALNTAGNIVGAAKLLGITRHALKRRIVKLELERPVRRGYIMPAPAPTATASAS